MDMISAIIEKEYIKEREGRSSVGQSTSSSTTRRNYD
jgi:hypothetical protein